MLLMLLPTRSSALVSLPDAQCGQVLSYTWSFHIKHSTSKQCHILGISPDSNFRRGEFSLTEHSIPGLCWSGQILLSSCWLSVCINNWEEHHQEPELVDVKWFITKTRTDGTFYRRCNNSWMICHLWKCVNIGRFITGSWILELLAWSVLLLRCEIMLPCNKEPSGGAVPLINTHPMADSVRDEDKTRKLRITNLL